jgi:formylglycine-generating enzyme required for sulfatase activity
VALEIDGVEEAVRTRLLAVPYAMVAARSEDAQQLVGEVTTLSGSVGKVETAVASLNGTVSGLSSTVEGVSSTVGELDGEFRVIDLGAAIDFGDVPEGTTVSRMLEVRNAGFGKLVVGSVTTGGAFAAEWSGEIPGWGTQEVEVSFSPTAQQSYAGSIAVASDAEKGPGSVEVLGRGVARTRIIELVGNLAFGDVPVGATVTRPLTIRNNGNVALTVGAITYPPVFSGESAGGVIEPGGELVRDVRFSPQAGVAYSGNVTVTSDATAGAGSIGASGFGLTSPSGMVAVDGGTMPAGSVFAGQSAGDLYVDKNEVTKELWEIVRDWAVANGYEDLASVGKGLSASHPAFSMNWYHAILWCNARSEREGLTPVYVDGSGDVLKVSGVEPEVNPAANGYRLPTALEWEWAARGGVFSQGFVYSGADDLDLVGWYHGNSPSGSKEVGTKSSNELGLKDMSGNLMEWVFTDSVEKYAAGGSWFDDAESCTVESRLATTFGDDTVGLRTVRARSGN